MREAWDTILPSYLPLGKQFKQKFSNNIDKIMNLLRDLPRNNTQRRWNLPNWIGHRILMWNILFCLRNFPGNPNKKWIDIVMSLSICWATLQCQFLWQILHKIHCQLHCKYDITVICANAHISKIRFHSSYL